MNGAGNNIIKAKAKGLKHKHKNIMNSNREPGFVIVHRQRRKKRKNNTLYHNINNNDNNNSNDNSSRQQQQQQQQQQQNGSNNRTSTLQIQQQQYQPYPDHITGPRPNYYNNDNDINNYESSKQQQVIPMEQINRNSSTFQQQQQQQQQKPQYHHDPYPADIQGPRPKFYDNSCNDNQFLRQQQQQQLQNGNVNRGTVQQNNHHPYYPDTIPGPRPKLYNNDHEFLQQQQQQLQNGNRRGDYQHQQTHQTTYPDTTPGPRPKLYNNNNSNEPSIQQLQRIGTNNIHQKYQPYPDHITGPRPKYYEYDNNDKSSMQQPQSRNTMHHQQHQPYPDDMQQGPLPTTYNNDNNKALMHQPQNSSSSSRRETHQHQPYPDEISGPRPKYYEYDNNKSSIQQPHSSNIRGTHQQQHHSYPHDMPEPRPTSYRQPHELQQQSPYHNQSQYDGDHAKDANEQRYSPLPLPHQQRDRASETYSDRNRANTDSLKYGASRGDSVRDDSNQQRKKSRTEKPRLLHDETSCSSNNHQDGKIGKSDQYEQESDKKLQQKSQTMPRQPTESFDGEDSRGKNRRHTKPSTSKAQKSRLQAEVDPGEQESMSESDESDSKNRDIRRKVENKSNKKVRKKEDRLEVSKRDTSSPRKPKSRHVQVTTNKYHRHKSPPREVAVKDDRKKKPVSRIHVPKNVESSSGDNDDSSEVDQDNKSYTFTLDSSLSDDFNSESSDDEYSTKSSREGSLDHDRIKTKNGKPRIIKDREPRKEKPVKKVRASIQNRTRSPSKEVVAVSMETSNGKTSKIHAFLTNAKEAATQVANKKRDVDTKRILSAAKHLPASDESEESSSSSSSSSGSRTESISSNDEQVSERNNNKPTTKISKATFVSNKNRGKSAGSFNKKFESLVRETREGIFEVLQEESSDAQVMDLGGCLLSHKYSMLMAPQKGTKLNLLILIPPHGFTPSCVDGLGCKSDALDVLDETLHFGHLNHFCCLSFGEPWVLPNGSTKNLSFEDKKNIKVGPRLLWRSLAAISDKLNGSKKGSSDYSLLAVSAPDYTAKGWRERIAAKLNVMNTLKKHGIWVFEINPVTTSIRLSVKLQRKIIKIAWDEYTRHIISVFKPKHILMLGNNLEVNIGKDKIKATAKESRAKYLDVQQHPTSRKNNEDFRIKELMSAVRESLSGK